MHGLSKKAINQEYLSNMDLLYERNFEAFKEYAMRDSLITLIHALFMQDFAFRIGSTSNPPTLGSLASKYLSNVWKADKYRGYQLDHNYLLGNAQGSVTP